MRFGRWWPRFDRNGFDANFERPPVGRLQSAHRRLKAFPEGLADRMGAQQGRSTPS
jgi:hypothetical protein